MRDEQPEGQRRLGAQLKHDLSVPSGQLVDFLDQANNDCREILDGVRINAFGHLGDGNVHFNLSPPAGWKDFSGLDNEFAVKLGRLATMMGGSFAAEHGLGRSKTALADILRDPVERGLMMRIKKALDDAEQLNPSVLITYNNFHDV